MIAINKPLLKVRKVFLDCISTVLNANEKKVLTDCVDLLESAETDFDIKFKTAAVHRIVQSDIIKGDIGKAEMIVVYNYRMVKSSMPGRAYYNLILSSAPYGKCPLCSIRIADTLDHYLPKSKYPIFAVTPITLIPACTPCNKGKNIEYPTKPEEQTFHPYYDKVDDVEWLKASIIRTNPITFDFDVNSPEAWSEILRKRAVTHFNAFNLNEIFSSHANEEYRSVQKQLIKLYNQDPELLKDHLIESYKSRLEIGINSWRALFYKALMDDAWFCKGGILL